jgi:hypothetical protein
MMGSESLLRQEIAPLPQTKPLWEVTFVKIFAWTFLKLKLTDKLLVPKCFDCMKMTK